MIWNREAELMPRERLERLQLERLRTTVARLLDRVPPMRDRLHASGLSNAADIRSLDQLAQLPFSRKTDLREHYPFGLFAVDRSEIIRVHASSGTRGKPTLVGYTRHDLEVWSEVVARTLAMGGVRPGMVLHIAAGYGLFTGGLGFHMGGELMGCTVVPAGGGFTQRQIMLMRDLGAQALKSTPSYCADAGQQPAGDGALRHRPEPRGRAVRRRAVDRSHATGHRARTRTPGDQRLRAVGGHRPGVSGECIEARSGMHLQEDHFLPEVIDPYPLDHSPRASPVSWC